MKLIGYCKLCRAKEIELYGTVLNTAGPRHARACREAGCDHPPVVKPRQERPKATVATDRNKRRSENRFAALHNRYQNARWAIIHAFDKARQEHWTHEQLLDHRSRWVFNQAFQKLPDWVKSQ